MMFLSLDELYTYLPELWQFKEECIPLIKQKKGLLQQDL